MGYIVNSKIDCACRGEIEGVLSYVSYLIIGIPIIDAYLVELDVVSIGIGHDVGKLLAQHFKTMDDILEACHDKYDFTNIDGIGKVTSDILKSGDFYSTLKDLCVNYINNISVNTLYKDKTKITDNINTNEKTLSFVLTGTMSKPRHEIEHEIKCAGNEVKNTITKKVDYLVTADPNSNSSKTTKAKALGIKIISEEELYSILAKE